MNAIPSDLARAARELSQSVTARFAGRRKIHVAGSRPDLRVPMREIAQSATPTLFGGEDNPSIVVYDTSGPYTDPAHSVDLAAGLPTLRAAWIAERGDVERLDGLSSSFGRDRANDARLDAIRFTGTRAPLRAKAGANVTQMHYARRGVITPEMEYIAIRENQRI